MGITAGLIVEDEDFPHTCHHDGAVNIPEFVPGDHVKSKTGQRVGEVLSIVPKLNWTYMIAFEGENGAREYYGDTLVKVEPYNSQEVASALVDELMHSLEFVPDERRTEVVKAFAEELTRRGENG